MILLYDQFVDGHFPPHYRKVYESIIRDNGGKILCLSHKPLKLESFYKAVIVRKENKFLGLLVLSFMFFIYSAFNGSGRKEKSVLVHDDVMLATTAYVISLLTKKRFYYRISHLKPETAMVGAGWGKAIILRFVVATRNFLMKRAHHVIYMSDRMHDYFNKSGVCPVACTVIPSCVDVDAYGYNGECNYVREVEESIKKAGHDLVIVYVGNINIKRGVSFIASVVKELRKSYNVGAIFFGANSQRENRLSLSESFEKNGCSSSLYLLNSVGPECLGEGIRLGDVGLSIFPVDSVFEVNSPLKALDYIASGIPVVGTKNPDQSFVIKNTNCGRVADMTPEDFATAIIGCKGISKGFDSNAIISWLKENRDISVAKSKIVDIMS